MNQVAVTNYRTTGRAGAHRRPGNRRFDAGVSADALGGPNENLKDSKTNHLQLVPNYRW